MGLCEGGGGHSVHHDREGEEQGLSSPGGWGCLGDSLGRRGRKSESGARPVQVTNLPQGSEQGCGLAQVRACGPTVELSPGSKGPS